MPPRSLLFANLYLRCRLDCRAEIAEPMRHLRRHVRRVCVTCRCLHWTAGRSDHFRCRWRVVVCLSGRRSEHRCCTLYFQAGWSRKCVLHCLLELSPNRRLDYCRLPTIRFTQFTELNIYIPVYIQFDKLCKPYLQKTNIFLGLVGV